MLKLTVESSKQNLLNKGVKEKAVRAIIRKAMKEVALKVLKKFIPIHFTRNAYVKYRAIWPQKLHKKAPNRPLFRTGKLQRNIMRSAKARALTGQMNVRLVMQMGRPARYTDKFLRDAVFATMKKFGFDYKEAQRIVFSTFAFGAKNVANFERKITFLTKTEKKTVAKWLKSIITGEFNRRQAGKKFRKAKRARSKGIRSA